MRRLREERDRLLVESDWMAYPDSPAISDAWKAYRQALRDLPATESDPENVTFPTAPS